MATQRVLRRLLEIEARRIRDSPYLQRLGIEPRELDDRKVAVALEHRDENLNRGGVIHGGAIASALTTACTLAAASSERSDEATRVSLLSINVSFLAAVRGREGDDAPELLASARVLRRGRDTVHIHADLFHDSAVVATALATCRISTDAGPPVEAYNAEAIGRPLFGAHPKVKRMSGSPYGQASSIEVLDEEGSSACLRAPLGPNEGAPGYADPGAVCGLADNCGAFSAYSHPGVTTRNAGSTVSLFVAFAPAVAGDLVGMGTVVGRDVESFCCDVRIGAAGTPAVAAVATVIYRVVGAPDGGSTDAAD